ncbi:MAG: hypothetical protein AAB491_01690 [Patescibacteria group bacterium]
MIKRIFADIVLFFCVFFAPWYAAVIFAVVFVFIFRNFWEIIIAGFFLDVLYSVSGSVIQGGFGFFFFLSLILFLATEKIKKQIRLKT